MNKKGNVVLSILFVVIFLFAFSLILFYVFQASDLVNDAIQEDTTMSSDAQQIYDDFNTDYPSIFDAAIIIAIVILWIVSIILSFFIDTHPILFGIIIILLVFVFFIAASLANVFQEEMDDTDNAVQANSFPMTNWVFDHFLEIIVTMAFSILIALFIKIKAG